VSLTCEVHPDLSGAGQTKALLGARIGLQLGHFVILLSSGAWSMNQMKSDRACP
jgi:hypothetical protein